MKNPPTIALSLLAAALLGAGCATSPYSNLNPSFAPPPVSTYYRGGTPDFASKGNPDPLGRKFRIGNIWIEICRCADFFAPGVGIEEDVASNVAKNFMPLRSQASASEAYTKLKPDLLAAKKESAIYRFNFILFEQYKNTMPGKYKYNMASPSDIAFLDGYPSGDWLWRLNNELSTRFPSLFSNDSEAFPVDAVLCIAYDGIGANRKESISEAWLLGLPQHGSLTTTDCNGKTALFNAKEGFTSHYDALAAALFKLSPPQWDQLARSNPDDFAWLKCKVPASEICDCYIAAEKKQRDIQLAELMRILNK